MSDAEEETNTAKLINFLTRPLCTSEFCALASPLVTPSRYTYSTLKGQALLSEWRAARAVE